MQILHDGVTRNVTAYILEKVICEKLSSQLHLCLIIHYQDTNYGQQLLKISKYFKITIFKSERKHLTCGKKVKISKV